MDRLGTLVREGEGLAVHTKKRESSTRCYRQWKRKRDHTRDGAVQGHTNTNWTKCRGSSVIPRGPGVDRLNSDRNVWINKTIYGRVTVAAPPRISFKPFFYGDPSIATEKDISFITNYKSLDYIRDLKMQGQRNIRR
ncbi:hypothetical protein N7530_010505 [Penicillium desertorum]|uniref:Uncharacterized protein n=1 Tax=Penicillium desertorum TaxID=1303715 RepID=A0A9W9WHL4_9EURO|nr:hypothetical protein N7530_010505 [Penicillium desertorum]